MTGETVVQRQVEAYNAHDLTAFLSCYSDDVVVRDPDGALRMTGIGALRTTYGELFRNHPDVHADIVRRLAVGSWVVDEEVLTSAGRSRRALIAYGVRGDAIHAVLMVTSEPEPD